MVKRLIKLEKCKLNKKLIYRIIIILLVTMFYIVMFIVYNIERIESKKLDDINKILIEAYGNESALLIDNAFKTAYSLKYQLEAIDNIDNITNSRIKCIVEPTLRSYDEFKGIYVVFKNKNQILNPYWFWDNGMIRSEFIDDNLAVDYLSKQIKNEKKIIKPEIQYLDDEPLLITSLEVPIVKNDEVIGVVGIDLSLEFFQALTEDLKTHDEMEISIISQEGLIITHCHTAFIGQSVFESTNSKLSIEESILKKLDVDNDRYMLLTEFNMGKTDLTWYLSLSVPNNMLNSIAKSISFHIVIVLLISSLILILFISYTVNKTLYPIKKVYDVMEIAYGGDLSVRTEIHSDDEIEGIGKGLNNLLDALEHHQNRLMLEIAANEALNNELEESIKSNDRIYFETIKSLVRTIETKDLYTGGHCDRVTNYSLEIGKALGLSSAEIISLTYGAVLHDIGKIGISENIIDKLGILSDEEYDEVKLHPIKGYEIIKDIHFLKSAKSIVLQHHERFDGGGYPFGIKGDEIDLNSRIVSVADSYDAMTSSRSYRETLTLEEAISELLINKGTQFDPLVVDVFIDLLTMKTENKIIS